MDNKESQSIKILILSHSSELGGAERSMIDLLDYWVKKGWVEPHLIIRIPLSNMVPELKKRGWKYYPIHYTNWSQRKPSSEPESVFRNARENAKAVAEIEKIIDKVKPQIVMTNTIVAPWAALAAHFKRIPHVWFVREYGDIDHQHVFEIGRDKMYQDIDTLSELVVTNSRTLAKHVRTHIPKEKVSTLYTPFDMDLLDRKMQQPAKNPFKSKDSLKIVVTGRIAPSKGQDEAARAVGELIKKGYDAELCVMGTPADPADAEVLHQVIKKYSIEDKVHLLGHQSNPLAIVRYADVGVMASQQEAFGRVTFEYMATSKPVVGANSGATPELISDGVNGFLYAKDNTKELISQLKKYAANKDLLAQHGRNARKRAEKMMIGSYSADRLYEQITECLKAPKTSRPLNFSRKWLDYPITAQHYIDESRVLSLRQMFKKRVRSMPRSIYHASPGHVKRLLLVATPAIPRAVRPKKMDNAYKKRLASKKPKNAKK